MLGWKTSTRVFTEDSLVSLDCEAGDGPREAPVLPAPDRTSLRLEKPPMMTSSLGAIAPRSSQDSLGRKGTRSASSPLCSSLGPRMPRAAFESPKRSSHMRVATSMPRSLRPG